MSGRPLETRPRRSGGGEYREENSAGQPRPSERAHSARNSETLLGGGDDVDDDGDDDTGDCDGDDEDEDEGIDM